MAANYGGATKLVRFLAWTQVAVPLAAVIVTIPASLVFLLFGGIIIVAPPIALGLVGLGIAKSLRAGTRAAAAVIWSLVLAGAYVALALHSRTWDPRTPGEADFFVVAQIVFWLAALGHLAVPVVLGSRPTKAETEAVDPYPELRPALWPWLVGAVAVLASIALGIAQIGEG